MIIWISVLIPLLLTGVVFVVWNHRITWWELSIQIAVPIFLTLIVKVSVEHFQTQSTEYLGGYVRQAAYYESWDEEVSCRHPIYRTDSKGNSHLVGYQHAYDVDWHPAYWEAYLSTSHSASLYQDDFERLARQFGNRRFVALHRSYHSKNGDKYVADWKGEPEKIEPSTVEHSYENRVQASQSVFNYQKVDPKELGLYDYPKLSGYHQRPILGNAGPSTIEGEKKIDYLNAMLGTSHQVRLYVLIFRNAALQAGIDQESYWKGGNKNEFVTCVGLSEENEVSWCHVFSWTEADLLKVDARAFVVEQKSFDLSAYADWLGANIPSRWKRKHFRDFSYLTVDPPLTAVIWTFVGTLVTSVGLGIWSVMNGIDSDRKEINWAALLKR